MNEKNQTTVMSPPVMEGRIMPPIGESGGANNRSTIFVVEQPQRRLQDLVVPATTLQHLRGLLTKIKYHHVLYDDFGLREIDPYGGRTAINLYGPPGTGKSFTAEAIAHELQMGIVRANYAEIESKYVGETAKNIQSAFRKAEDSGALLFFDEADSILGRRLSNVRQSTDHAVNVSRSVMLLELDRFTGVTVFATNLASNYDTAFVRRILGHIEMPLPTKDLRRRLWESHIPNRMPTQLTEGDWLQLVEQSEGLSGGDILNCVINAAARALERDGKQCIISIDDFLVAIHASHCAKREVGAVTHVDTSS